MDREAEVNVMASMLIMLGTANEQERESSYAVVPWRTLDAIADMFRKGGVDPRTPNLGHYDTCSVCSLSLDPEKGELFVGEDGKPYCNDHYPDRDIDIQLELDTDRIEREHQQELDRKLRERP